MDRISFADALGHDLRFGLRLLRKTPAFTLTAALTLGPDRDLLEDRYALFRQDER